jgi:hypothetical protein
MSAAALLKVAAATVYRWRTSSVRVLVSDVCVTVYLFYCAE